MPEETWDIRFTDPAGDRVWFDNLMSESQAREYVREMKAGRLGEEFAEPEAVDRLELVKQDFPIGARVRLQMHWEREYYGFARVVGAYEFLRSFHPEASVLIRGEWSGASESAFVSTVLEVVPEEIGTGNGTCAMRGCGDKATWIPTAHKPRAVGAYYCAPHCTALDEDPHNWNTPR
ncbi:hypothetical protein OG225_43145 (plasmid) [Nocardia sp. NBC_01377]|uniref:hypothetical protein n=1 Tax=Nocardia sp. NBC_01377 TaxID=2903595 RepID=UPI002F916EFA